MARSRDNSISGRVGDRIHSSWRGRPYTRAYPETVSNPRTEEQQAHRNAFAALSRLSSYMKAAHSIGLYHQANRMKLNTHCAFKKLNSVFVTDQGIKYPLLILSKGPVTSFEITKVRLEGQTLHVDYDGKKYDYNSYDFDNICMFAYCADLCQGCLFEPSFRVAGSISGEIPSEWIGPSLHLYLFALDPQKRASETIHVGFEEILRPEIEA